MDIKTPENVCQAVLPWVYTLCVLFHKLAFRTEQVDFKTASFAKLYTKNLS